MNLNFNVQGFADGAGVVIAVEHGLTDFSFSGGWVEEFEFVEGGDNVTYAGATRGFSLDASVPVSIISNPQQDRRLGMAISYQISNSQPILVSDNLNIGIGDVGSAGGMVPVGVSDSIGIALEDFVVGWKLPLEVNFIEDVAGEVEVSQHVFSSEPLDGISKDSTPLQSGVTYDEANTKFVLTPPSPASTTTPHVLSAAYTPMGASEESDWLAQSQNWQAAPGAAPNVVYANDFRTQAEFDVGVFPDSKVGNVTRSQERFLSGGNSLKFDIFNTDGANSGNWRTWLRPEFGVAYPGAGSAFGEGDEFYMSYRLYIPTYLNEHVFLTDAAGSGGWKTHIISVQFGSSNDMAVVMNNDRYRGYLNGYHKGRDPGSPAGVFFRGWDSKLGVVSTNCAGSDFRHQPDIDRGIRDGSCLQDRRNYGGLFSQGTPSYGQLAESDPETGAVRWPKDDWLSIQTHVQVGNFDQPNSTIEVWAANPGEDWQTMYSEFPVHIGPLGIDNQGNPETGYQTFWLTPFDTNKIADPTRQDTAMYYDQIIVSTAFIPAAGF